MKKIGLHTSTAFIVGNMIGSGIFLLPSTLAALGGISFVGWACSTVGAFLFVLLFRGLSSHFPNTVGGPYAYTRTVLGEFFGFLVGWGYWISVWCTNAAIAVAFVGYLAVFIPQINHNEILSIAFGVGALWLFSFLNFRDIVFVGRIQKLTTVLKILPLLLIGFVGLFYVDWSLLDFENLSGETDFKAISQATTLTLFAYLGIESASITSHKIKKSEANVGRSGLIGFLLTAFIYILCSVVIFGLVSTAKLSRSTAPFSDASAAFLGSYAEQFVALVALIATLGALNGWILIQGQIAFALAKDGLFPAFFKKRNQAEVPYIGIVVSSLLATFLLIAKFSGSLVDVFSFMMNLSTLSALTPYFLSAVSLFIFIRRGKNASKGMQIVAVLSGLFCLWMIYGVGIETVSLGVVLLLIGIFMYLLKTIYEKNSRR
ncbi:MAG: amino acid permease [Flavobacteriaceae bacterium]|nr:amino acid permease [Flavobacteriaceae bacterium]